MPTAVGRSLQDSLVSHGVSQRLVQGLGSGPRVQPSDQGRRVPIYVAAGSFDSGDDEGVAAKTCADAGVDGVVVRANLGANKLAIATAHELFHAFSAGRQHAVPTGNWFEEAAATWFEGVAGFPEDAEYDEALEPRLPIDYFLSGDAHQYAMSRFLQFLDDQSLVRGTGGSWPLVRSVIDGYASPGPTVALQQALVNKKTLEWQSAAFWGERLGTPRHGPTIRDDEYVDVKLQADDATQETQLIPLQTKVRRYTLAADVQRVVFEYHLPRGAYAWALPDPAADAVQVEDGDTLSFCRIAGDDDDLTWPKNFRTSLSDGNVDGGTVTASVEVHATTATRGCTAPEYNDACRLIKDAGIDKIYSPGQWLNWLQTNDGDVRAWICFRVRNSDGDGIQLGESKYRNITLKELRRKYRTSIANSGFAPLSVGDVAGFKIDRSGDIPVVQVMMLVGKTAVFFLAGGDRAYGLELARKFARHM